MDSKDLDILNILQDEGDLSKAELARRVDLTPPAVVERLRKLRERGTIEGTSARLNPEHLGLPTLAFVLVQTDPKRTDAAAAFLADIPAVLEVHHVAGEDCLLVKVRSGSMKELSALLRESLHRVEAVRSTRSIIVLETVKESTALPIETRKEPERVSA